MRQIPVKNYVLAVFIVVSTILITLIAANIYMNRNDYNNKNYLKDLNEIKLEEIENYIVEAHDIMIYVTNSESTNKIIDKKFKDMIKDNDYNQDVVYLNLNDIDELLYKSFKDKYGVSDTKNNTLFIFKDGKLTKEINFNEKNISLALDYIKVYYGE